MLEPIKKDVIVIKPSVGLDAKKLIRVAAYCRVSTDSEEQNDSFIMQVKYYNDFISRSDDMILVDIYADEGITGTSTNKREEFKRMLKDSKAGKIDRVYVKSVSRFARNSLECIENIRLLQSYGTSVFFENDGIDTGKMNSEMILYLKSAFAQSEALGGSKRVSTAVRMRMESGEFITCTAPFGYRLENGMLYPIPEEAEIVKEIFSEFLSGMGFCLVARKLNELYPSYRNWNGEAIRYILTNEKYIGDSLLRKTFTPNILPLRNIPNKGQVDKFYVTGSHEAIISREVFEKAQTLMKMKRSKYNNFNKAATYDFSKMIVCGDCGCHYKRRKQKDGVAWICSNKGMPGKECHTHNVSEDQIERSFISMYNKLQQNKHVIIDYAISQLVSIKSKMSGGKSEINDIDVQIASLCNQNNMLVQTKAKGIIDDMSFLEMTGSIQKEISKLRDRRLKIIREDDEEGTIEKLREVNAFLEQSPKAIIMFDTVLFKELVSEIISTADYELIFVLKCGLKLKERLK